jgi:hypothetical protein
VLLPLEEGEERGERGEMEREGEEEGREGEREES